jgi:ergothioneine biosynthesis protein EgtB
MPAVHPQPVPGEDIRAFYERVRSHTMALCEPLEIEDFIPQPIEDVSPPKWNIAHTTWFFEEMVLKPFLPDYPVFDESFAFLFNSYYNTVGERTERGRRGEISRPTVRQVMAYRKHVDEHMLQMLGREMTDELRKLVILGLNHEQQHQELFITDLKFTFAQNPLFPVYRADFFPVESTAQSDAGFLTVPEGIYGIGYDGHGFCFDNELSRHRVFLEEFGISNALVTNREFLEFVKDGGYGDHRLWHSEGWDWVKRESVTTPMYWHMRDGDWYHYTLGGLRPLPPQAPVCHVSFYEASAFAEWSGARLPTEFEWEAANSHIEWGLRWEWTNSAYLPYPGFHKPGGAVGEYNGKFMINQMVLRGASVVTPHGHSRPTYRNFFHPHLRWQFTGIRLAK